MKKYTEFINERREHNLTIKDSQEFGDFLDHVLNNMDNEPNLLRAAYARIQGILSEVRKGNFTKSSLPFLFNTIFYFIEGDRSADQIKNWSEKLMELDVDNYDILLNIVNDYNHLLNKYKNKYECNSSNIKSWMFEPEGIKPIDESKSYEDYCDFGCGYIATYLAENPDIDEDEFGEYVTQHNKADRDMGELQDVCEEEIERLGKEFKKQHLKESLLLEFNASIISLSEVDKLFKIMGFDDKGASIMKKLTIRNFKNGGDDAVVDFLKKTLGVNVYNVSKGKYSFEPYS